MTLTDIIAKITLFAKRAIVNDNSSNTTVSINQAGSGTGLSVASTTGTAVSVQASLTSPLAGGTLEVFKSSGGDFVYDGGGDGVFVFSNTSSVTTKATAFTGANVGIGTTTPLQALDVNGGIRTNNTVFLNNTAATNRFVSYQTNQLTRWDVGADNAAESGGNAGSDFFIHSFNDAGVFISRPLHITRSTGNVGINTSTPARKLHVNGLVRLQGLSTYANNAAAITGGLAADDVYKTATGELRIVV